MQQKISQEIKTFLLAYNLCESAISCQNVLKEHICQSLFHASIIAYYSICKSKKEKEWILNLLQDPKQIKFIYLRRDISIPQKQPLHEKMKAIFEKYEKIRDKNIAHKDPKGKQEQGKSWLKIPPRVGGSDDIPGTIPFIYGSAFITFPLKEQKDFLTLIELTLDLWWRKDNLQIIKKSSDGIYKYIPQPYPID